MASIVAGTEWQLLQIADSRWVYVDTPSVLVPGGMLWQLEHVRGPPPVTCKSWALWQLVHELVSPEVLLCSVVLLWQPLHAFVETVPGCPALSAPK